MQIQSFETVIKFTKARLTRNRRQSRSASGNREALKKQKTSTILVWETRLLQLENRMEFSCWLQNNVIQQYQEHTQISLEVLVLI
jgi:hypothetical protein